MLGLLWRLTRGYRLCPWRSPYLRWRLETYWGVHAETITFAGFWRFAWRHRRELAGYLRWAGKMERQTRAARLTELDEEHQDITSYRSTQMNTD